MSLVFNMVGGGSGGGGGPSPSDAILTVTVPTGSTVTATKGGITLTPTMWVQAADPTLDCALFVIAPSLFDSQNAWTVTATLDNISKSKTVTVSAAKQYDVTIKLIVIYNLGNEYTSLTGGIHQQKGIASSGYSLGTMTKNADNIYVYAGDSQGSAAVTINKIDVTGCKTLCVYATAAGGSTAPRLCFTNDSDGGITNSIANKQFSNTGLTTLDISTVGTKTGYVSMRCLGANHTNSNVTFTKIWAEG